MKVDSRHIFSAVWCDSIFCGLCVQCGGPGLQMNGNTSSKDRAVAQVTRKTASRDQVTANLSFLSISIKRLAVYSCFSQPHPRKATMVKVQDCLGSLQTGMDRGSEFECEFRARRIRMRGYFAHKSFYGGISWACIS